MNLPNGLDIPGKSQFRKFIASGMSEDKIIIISTHQVRDVDRILDHVLIMDNSRVLLNESTVNIQKCLLFKETDDASLLANAIYSLPSVQGHNLMLRNLKDEESDINLELLFNATLSQPKLLIELFLKTINDEQRIFFRFTSVYQSLPQRDGRRLESEFTSHVVNVWSA